MSQLVAVRLPVDGTLTIGEDLFTHGIVFAGSEPVAEPGEPKAAQFVRGALLHDPTQDVVEVPTEPFLTRTATDEWFAAFERAARDALRGIADARLKEEIVNRALVMGHAR
jgi:hypothetical protein